MKRGLRDKLDLQAYLDPLDLTVNQVHLVYKDRLVCQEHLVRWVHREIQEKKDTRDHQDRRENQALWDLQDHLAQTESQVYLGPP